MPKRKPKVLWVVEMKRPNQQFGRVHVCQARADARRWVTNDRRIFAGSGYRYRIVAYVPREGR